MSNDNVVLEDPTLAALRAAASEIEYLLTRSSLAKPDKDRHTALLSLLQRQSAEYAAHLAAQAEWPSEEDAAMVLHSFDGSFNDGGIDYRMRLGRMRAALQSARPPVGVVSDDHAALLYLMQQFDAETWECPNCGHSEDTATMDSAYYLREYLASRHAPTKD